MSKSPFFSVVVPTKNRPNYLKDTISSVLGQNFSDFELIVSDNFNDDRTQHVISEFTHNPKVISVRPKKELNMINHWEFATKQATGKFVIVLADRKVLFQSSLKKLHANLVKNNELNILSFGVKTYNEDQRIVLDSKKFSNELEMCSSLEAGKNFVEQNLFQRNSWDYKFPKSLNSVYRRSYSEKIREEFGAYFNYPEVTTPDYSSFFINVSQNDKFGYLDTPIILTQGEKSSNGRNFGAGKFKAYMDSLNLKKPYELVPMNVPWIYNLLFSDFLVIQKNFEGNLNEVNPNWLNYYATNRYELERKLNSNLLSEKMVDEFFTIYNNSLNKLSENEQQQISKLWEEYEQNHKDWNDGNIKRSFSDYMRLVKSKLFSPKPYNSILEAAKIS